MNLVGLYFFGHLAIQIGIVSSVPPVFQVIKLVLNIFKHHKFLDVGRNKPIPHESYYAVAAYFYLFGHYYAAAVIDTLPEEKRVRYGILLRDEILKCRQKDGSFWDFWIASTTKSYGTAFSIMALAETIERWD